MANPLGLGDTVVVTFTKEGRPLGYPQKWEAQILEVRLKSFTPVGYSRTGDDTFLVSKWPERTIESIERKPAETPAETPKGGRSKTRRRKLSRKMSRS